MALGAATRTYLRNCTSRLHDLNMRLQCSMWETIESRLIIFLLTVMQNPALMAVKSSILSFYLSLSKTTPRVFRQVTIATLIVVNVGGFILTVLNIVQCRPLHFVLEYPLQPTKCTDILRLYFSAAPLNIITDVAIFSLPIPILTGLRLPRKQKIILVGVFG
jgi:hypothetical protein